MKALLITNMYPSDQKRYAGIFVKNQFEELLRLKSANESIDIFFMRRSFTSFLGTGLKYIKTVFRFIPVMFKKYQVIHLHYFYPLIILAWLYKVFHPSTKLLVTFHGSDINLQINKKNISFFRFFAKKIDFTIPVGEEVKKKVESKLNIKANEVIPVGINENVFYQMKNVEKEYDFIFVGSFFKIKGADILLNTIKSLSKEIRFCIVGKGEQFEKDFLNLKREGYNVTLLIDQSQDELRTLYNKSRFLYSPSRSEGFSTVTIEAMYCGIPVITSNIPQFKEQVVPNTNGYIFSLDKNDSITVLTNALNLSNMAYTNLSKGALNSFPNLSLSTVCAKILEIYRG